MRKSTKKSKKTRTTNKHNKLKIYESRPLDQIKTCIELNEDKKYNSMYICNKCDKQFQDEHTLNVHFKTKSHKKRIKEWEMPFHTTKAAENAAGLF